MTVELVASVANPRYSLGQIVRSSTKYSGLVGGRQAIWTTNNNLFVEIANLKGQQMYKQRGTMTKGNGKFDREITCLQYASDRDVQDNKPIGELIEQQPREGEG